MENTPPIPDPRTHLMRHAPDAPVLYFSPERLQATAQAFRQGFPGLVTYAVKANPGEEVLANLARAGITAFDVASPAEMRAVRAVAPDAAVARGFTPSMTFHPGTQCADPAAWGSYIAAAADVARSAGVRLHRLNVGGGFASHRTGPAPDLTAIFTHIGAQVAQHFGAHAPQLVCEPGRAMVAEAFSMAVRVKALRDSGAIFVNDGVYGGLTEIRDIGAPDRIEVIAPDGSTRRGALQPRVVFGPTCDSIDRLPAPLPLPEDLAEGDYLLIHGMGAYTCSLSTDFNGYGLRDVVTVARL